MGRRLAQGHPYGESSARLGTRVRRHRTNQGWSQQHLATQAGISYATVRAVERGVTGDPGVFTVLALADALQIQLTDLVTPTEATDAVDERRQ